MKGQQPIDLTIRRTHRSALLDSDEVITGGDLFGSAMPVDKNKRYYSIKWGGQYPGEHMLELNTFIMNERPTVPEVLDHMDKIGEQGYRGVP